MMTFSSRGRGPTSATSSSTVFTLWLRNLRLASSINVSLCHIFEPDLAGLGDRLRIPQRCFTPIVDLPEYVAHALFETHLGTPSQVARDRGNVRMRPFRLPRTFAHVDHLTAQQFDQPVDGLRVTRAQVPDLSRQRRFRRQHEGLRNVGDVEEITRLRAVADHGERLSCNLL